MNKVSRVTTVLSNSKIPVTLLKAIEVNSELQENNLLNNMPNSTLHIVLDSPKKSIIWSNSPCQNPADSVNVNEGLICKNSHNTQISQLSPIQSAEEDVVLKLKTDICHSMCSLQCIATRNMTNVCRKSPPPSVDVTDVENVITSTDLDDATSLKTDTHLKASFVCAYSYNEPIDNAFYVTTGTKFSNYSNFSREYRVARKASQTSKQDRSALYFFSHKKDEINEKPSMKKSKKCTNLVKYKLTAEPALTKPFSKSMLLHRKMKGKENKMIGMAIVCKRSNETQATSEKRTQSLQDEMTKSEYDLITEKLIISLLGGDASKATKEQRSDINYYIGKMVQELYEMKFNEPETHPVKVLFRCLLEYWVRNTCADYVQNAAKYAKSIAKPSNNYFTKDANVSSVTIHNATKETQFEEACGTKQLKKKHITDKKHHDTKRSDSYDKERRVQQLERLLKNTVYICETVRSNQSREKDILITKRLMDNLGKFPIYDNSNGSSNDDGKENKSNSSAEYPMIQETFNRLISETSIPPDVAKEFLGAYLDVLMHDSQQSNRNSSSYTSTSKYSHERGSKEPICQVQTESVQKRVSKSITAFEIDSTDKKNILGSRIVDPGQLYLKEVLDKITSIFTTVKRPEQRHIDRDVQPDDTKVEGSLQNELRIPIMEYFGKKVTSENPKENSVVIDLSKYDLEHISMLSDSNVKGRKSLSLLLKERPPNFGEPRAINLNFKFANDNRKSVAPPKYSTKKIYHNHIDPLLSFKNPYIDYDRKINEVKDKFKLKPFISNSDIASRQYSVLVCESEHSVDLTFKNNKFTDKSYSDSRKTGGGNEEPQSCYILANLKKSAQSVFQTKKKVRLKECHGVFVKAQSSKCTRRHSELDLHNSSPKVIDENFILLLLENLNLLSRNLPTMHNDINALYLKLLKRHEAKMKASGNSQILGLLGQIYSETESPKFSDEIGIQFDSMHMNKCSTKETVTSGVCVIFEHKKNADKCLSACDHKTPVDSIPTQTNNTYKNKNTLRKSVQIATTSKIEPDLIDPHSLILKFCRDDLRSTVVDRFLKRDCALSTALRDLLQKNSQNFRFFSKNRPKKSDEINHSSLKQELIKETCLLKALIKVSTESQTVDVIKDIIKNDYKISNIFLSKKYDTKSSFSTVELCTRKFSEDLKTIYKCNSERSSCSG